MSVSSPSHFSIPPLHPGCVVDAPGTLQHISSILYFSEAERPRKCIQPHSVWLNTNEEIVYISSGDFYQDLGHFSLGFTHTPPVGLSITYTSPSVSWTDQDNGVGSSGSREEHWRQTDWLLTFFWMRTTAAGEEHASILWHMPAAPTRWNTTSASMEDFEPRCPILWSLLKTRTERINWKRRKAVATPARFRDG